MSTDNPDKTLDEVDFESERFRRMSVQVIPGKEGKHVARGTPSGKAIAIWTSGGDSQGIITLCICYL